MTEADEVRTNTMKYILQYFQCGICGSKQSICNGFQYACAVGDPADWNHSRENSKTERHGKVFITPDPEDFFDPCDTDSDE
jgi:hypothetical protein